MQMRWHWPPENWWGRRSAATAGSRPTSSSTCAPRRPAPPRCRPSRSSRGSGTMSRTLRRGFSDEIGSWKIICICGAQLAHLLVLQDGESRARRTMMLPLVGRGSCMMARPVVDLPQPDSPTRPSVSPGQDVEADARHRVHLAGRCARRGTRRRGPRRAAACRRRRGGARCRCPAIRPRPAPWPLSRRSSRSPCGARGHIAGHLVGTSGEPTGYQQAYTWPGVSASDERRLLLAAPVLRVRAPRARSGSPSAG